MTKRNFLYDFFIVVVVPTLLIFCNLPGNYRKLQCSSCSNCIDFFMFISKLMFNVTFSVSYLAFLSFHLN